MFVPFLLLGDDVFEIWVVGFVGFDVIGSECVDGDAFVGVIAIPEGLGWGVSGAGEFVSVFGFLDDEDVWVMGKDGGVFVSKGALTVPGDEGHGVVSLAGAMGTANGVCFPVIKRKSGKRKNKGMLQEE